MEESHRFIFQHKPRPPKPRPPGPKPKPPLPTIESEPIAQSCSASLEDIRAEIESEEVIPWQKKAILGEVLTCQLQSGDQEAIDKTIAMIEQVFCIPEQLRILDELGVTLPETPPEQPDPTRLEELNQKIAILEEASQLDAIEERFRYLMEFQTPEVAHKIIEELTTTPFGLNYQLQIEGQVHIIESLFASAEPENIRLAYLMYQQSQQSPLRNQTVFPDMPWLQFRAFWPDYQTSGQPEPEEKWMIPIGKRLEAIGPKLEEAYTALQKYSLDIAISSYNLDALPEEEKELIKNRSQKQRAAVALYKDFEVDGDGSTGDSTNLHIDDQEMAVINHDAKSATAIERLFLIQHRGNTTGYDYLSTDEAYYEQYLISKSDRSYSSHGSPQVRISQRQEMLTFLNVRGAALDPALRARIYIDLGTNYLHKKIRERDPELGEQFLTQAITILENYEDAGNWHFRSTSPEQMLGYAHYRRAALYIEQEKSHEEITKEFQKAIAIAPEGDFEKEDNFDIIFDAYVDYILGQANGVQELLGACYEYQKTYLEGEPSEERYSYNQLLAKHLVRARIRCINILMGEKSYEEAKQIINKMKENAYFKPYLEGPLEASSYSDRDDKTRFPHDDYLPLLIEHLDFLSSHLQEGGGDGAENSEMRRYLAITDGFAIPGGETENDVMRRYANSPVVGVEYDDIMAGGPSAIYLLRRNPADWKLLQARLYDTYSPAGQQKPELALYDYMDALRMTGIPTRSTVAGRRKEDPDALHLLGNQDMAEAVARCYFLLNSPTQYSVSDFGIDWLDARAGTVGEPLEFNTEKKEAYIENASSNLRVLYYDDETNMGIAVNRYINMPLMMPGTVQDLSEEWQSLRQQRRELDPETDADELEQIEARIGEIKKDLRPDEVGYMYWIAKNDETSELEVNQFPINNNAIFQWEEMDNPEALGIEDLSLPSRTNPANKSDLGNGWHTLVDTDYLNSDALYLTDDLEIVEQGFTEYIEGPGYDDFPEDPAFDR